MDKKVKYIPCEYDEIKAYLNRTKTKTFRKYKQAKMYKNINAR